MLFRSYVKAVVNPSDEVSVKRVLNVPKRGIGDTSEGRIDAYARAHGLSFFEALRRADDVGLAGRSAKAIASFVALVDELSDVVADGPARLIEAALDRSGYVAELEAESTVDAEGRIENLAELVGVAQGFDDVDAFLEQVSLVADTDALLEDDSQVTLMTLHSAKGLEYPVVFLIGCEEGIFPHNRALLDPRELEEERRLAYVGITRAREKLHVSHAWQRMLFGQSQYNPPSRFLAEIPAELFDRQGSVDSGSDSSRAYGGSGTWRDRELPEYRRRDEEPSGRTFGAGAPRREQKAPTPAKSAEEYSHLRVGDDVTHAIFGDGVILSISGEGEKTEATVRFRERGTKHLLLAWAPLKKI